MNNSDISRHNIQENTKNLLGEISEIDQEIVALQGTLYSAFTNRNNPTEQSNMNDGSQILVSESNLLDDTNNNQLLNSRYNN